MKHHRQLWVKVNVLVDRSIKDLITALSLFPKLQTIESCQGNNNNSAWVSFYYGKNGQYSWKELANFIFKYFGPRLAKEVGDRVDLHIRVSENGQIFGELFVRKKALPVVTKAIIKLSQNY